MAGAAAAPSGPLRPRHVAETGQDAARVKRGARGAKSALSGRCRRVPGRRSPAPCPSRRACWSKAPTQAGCSALGREAAARAVRARSSRHAAGGTRAGCSLVGARHCDEMKKRGGGSTRGPLFPPPSTSLPPNELFSTITSVARPCGTLCRNLYRRRGQGITSLRRDSLSPDALGAPVSSTALSAIG